MRDLFRVLFILLESFLNVFSMQAKEGSILPVESCFSLHTGCFKFAEEEGGSLKW